MALNQAVGRTVTAAGAGPRPCRAVGLRLLGPYEGSGFQDVRYLVERADRQMAMLTRLLYLIARYADGRTSTSLLADRVSRAYGQRLDVEDLVQLIEDKLGPAGLVGLWSAPNAGQRRADPLLSLSVRGVLLPAAVVRTVGRIFAPLFAGPVIVAVLGAMAVLDWWLVTHLHAGDVIGALIDPIGVLTVVGLLLVATLFHEFGHAAGCTRGGADPGAIGVGLYLWLPAFYTNVTDAYRLGRAGRLRTDLGGVYFNAVFIVLASAGYLWTGWAPLVAVAAFCHLEILQQLLPLVRFDGYYILGDLAGVPNLFGHVRPILSSLIPGHRNHPDVSRLRARTRTVVTIWVLVTVPALIAGFGFMVWRMPDYVRSVWQRAGQLADQARELAGAGQVGAALVAVVSIVMITLPVVGIALLLGRTALHLARYLTWRLVVRPIVRGETLQPDGHREDPMDTAAPLAELEAVPTTPDTPHFLTTEADESVPPGASTFTEQSMLRARAATPRGGWRRAVYASSGGRVNPGPSAAERRERDAVSRIRARVAGPRRIVVLSRKGGVGKTTTTLMLGHTFAVHRGDRVIALDANPDAGSLAYRVRRESPETVTSLLSRREFVNRYADVRDFTSQAPTRLEVIASDDDPLISHALGDYDYHAAIGLLSNHYNLIMIDTGTGILDGAVQGVLRLADQIVVVMPPALDGARVAAATLDWLDRHGHSDLVENAVAVVNGVRGRPRRLQLEEIESHFATRCAAVVRVPWDPALEAGAETELDELRPATRDAYVRLAESVADGFSVDRWRIPQSDPLPDR